MRSSRPTRCSPGAQEVAAEAAATLNTGAHVASKLKARAEAITAIRAGIDGLAKEFVG